MNATTPHTTRYSEWYRTPGWFIDTFQIRRGNYYKYRLSGFNEFAAELERMGRHTMGTSINWEVPTLSGAYAFRLREVPHA